MVITPLTTDDFDGDIVVTTHANGLIHVAEASVNQYDRQASYVFNGNESTPYISVKIVQGPHQNIFYANTYSREDGQHYNDFIYGVDSLPLKT